MANPTIRELADKCTAREAYAELCRECGTDAITEEHAILSTAREHLPPCAQTALDGGNVDDAPEYWLFLADQTVTAQEEHDATIAASRGA